MDPGLTPLKVLPAISIDQHNTPCLMSGGVGVLGWVGGGGGCGTRVGSPSLSTTCNGVIHPGPHIPRPRLTTPPRSPPLPPPTCGPEHSSALPDHRALKPDWEEDIYLCQAQNMVLFPCDCFNRTKWSDILGNTL